MVKNFNTLFYLFFTNVITYAQKYLENGLAVNATDEEKRKIYLLNSFDFIAFLFVFPLGLLALYHEKNILALSLLLIAFIVIFNYFLLKLSSYHKKNELVSYILSSLFFILMTYLVYTGGVDNTGPLWIYALPMIVMFLLGLSRGIYAMLLFFIVITYVLFFLDVTSYLETYKIRMLLSLILVTFLTAVYEYSRKSSFQKLSHLSQTLAEEAHKDVLTEVLNRRGIEKELENVCRLYKKEKKTFSIMLCDIDYFKNINDKYGHTVGDSVLKAVANEIKNNIRQDDFLARWGGEEFLVLLPKSRLDGACRVGEKIRKSISEASFVHEGKIVTITISIGISEKDENTSTVYEVIKHADKHMYDAKEEGRNRVHPIQV